MAEDISRLSRTLREQDRELKAYEERLRFAEDKYDEQKLVAEELQTEVIRLRKALSEAQKENVAFQAEIEHAIAEHMHLQGQLRKLNGGHWRSGGDTLKPTETDALRLQQGQMTDELRRQRDQMTDDLRLQRDQMIDDKGRAVDAGRESRRSSAHQEALPGSPPWSSAASVFNLLSPRSENGAFLSHDLRGYSSEDSLRTATTRVTEQQGCDLDQARASHYQLLPTASKEPEIEEHGVWRDSIIQCEPNTLSSVARPESPAQPVQTHVDGIRGGFPGTARQMVDDAPRQRTLSPEQLRQKRAMQSILSLQQTLVEVFDNFADRRGGGDTSHR